MGPTLAEDVRILEQAYADLHALHGQLLATLTLPANRREIRKNSESAIEVMFGIVDKAKERFESMAIPQPRP
jgi:hypothetical protein